jgi:hypothetical protein
MNTTKKTFSYSSTFGGLAVYYYKNRRFATDTFVPLLFLVQVSENLVLQHFLSHSFNTDSNCIAFIAMMS